MDRVIAALPGAPNLKLHKVLARRAMAQGTWRPQQPSVLAEFVENAECRVVESAQQLQDVVVESLTRFQTAMHGELSPVRDLWDKSGEGLWRPVDELDLADRVARHLRDDLEERGIIVNREVKIRRGLPGVDGEQTDIYVDAMSAAGNIGMLARVSVIIEVKGCWHADVCIAMATQLVGRYLRNNYCTHGLYLVGWFVDDGWTDEDSRKARAKRNYPGGLTDARESLQRQAIELSRDGKVIASFVLDARLKPGKL